MAVGRVGLVDPVGLMEVIDGDLTELLLCYDTWRGDGVFIKVSWERQLKEGEERFFVSRRETYFGAQQGLLLMGLLPYRVLLGFESIPDKIRPIFIPWKSSPSIRAGAEPTRLIHVCIYFKLIEFGSISIRYVTLAHIYIYPVKSPAASQRTHLDENTQYIGAHTHTRKCAHID